MNFKTWNIEKTAWLIAIIVNSVFLLYFLLPYPENFLLFKHPSVKVYDRNDELLMEIIPDQSGISEAVDLEKVPDMMIELLLFSEDKNFYRHQGVSVQAIARAVWENLTRGDIVSGASTLSQQLVKMKYDIYRNDIATKILEVFRAVRLDLHFSKDEILQAYLTHIFLGNQIYGIEKAAEIYFSKDVENLDLLEMASLIIMIPSPSIYDVYDEPEEVRDAAIKFLRKAAAEKIVQADLVESLTNRELTFYETDLNFYAPHFSFWAIEQAKEMVPEDAEIQEIHTTVDLQLYQDLLPIIQEKIEVLKKKNANQASFLMIDNPTREILVMIGSVDYFETEGQINGATTLIQPGSSMKPFTYSLALESGDFTCSSIIPDIYTEFPSVAGKYIPDNFDYHYHGPVRLPYALGSSFNISAVYVLSQIGVDTLYQFLKSIGFNTLQYAPRYYGLGLTLGNADITLYDLVNGYTIFPNGGMYRELKGIRYVVTSDGEIYAPETEPETQVISEESAFLISHILSEFKYKLAGFGYNSPVNFPFKLAVKTGTSKSFRDNTVVCYNPHYTIGMWVGNFSGDPMDMLPASQGAGSVLRNVLIELYNQGYDFTEEFDPSRLEIVRREICDVSGMLPHDGCTTSTEYFIAETEPLEVCNWHKDGVIVLPEIYSEWIEDYHPEGDYVAEFHSDLKIISPDNEDVYRFDPLVLDSSQLIKFQALSVEDEVIWSVNGETVGSGKTYYWQMEPGEYELQASVVTGESRETITETVTFNVLD